MKRFFSVLLLFSLLSGFCVCSVSASVPGDLSAYLQNGTLKKGETITVRFELGGLSDTDGAVITENHFDYDPEILEFVSCKANHPDGWDFENDIAEDWSARDQKQDNNGNTILLDSVNLTVMDAKMEHPVKKDHVLFMDVEFKLKKDVSELTFKTHDCYWASFSYKEELKKNDFTRFDMEDRTIVMSLTAPEIKEESENSGLSTGALIAIIAGAAVLVGAVAAGAVFFSKKKKA